MDRRNFLRTGGMALLGSLAAGSVLAMPSSAKGAMGGGDQKAALSSAMNHFGVSEENMRKVLAGLKREETMLIFSLNIPLLMLSA